jgi:3-oxoacyl-[acyl-carrier protein] reductase
MCAVTGRLEQKTALITGGSRGIGKATVELFAKEGAKVYFTYNKNKESAEKICAELTANGGFCKALQCDIESPDDCGSAVRTVITEQKRLDILVNNAGITRDGFFIMQSPEAWRSVIDVNLLGTYNMLNKVIIEMLANGGGSIVNVSSVSGIKLGVGGQTNYSAAKAALVGITKSLCKEVGGKGIRVNAVAPGYIDTGMTAKVKSLENLIDHVPMKRLGKPEEVASVIAFLASDDASFVNGEVVVIDGGLSA